MRSKLWFSAGTVRSFGKEYLVFLVLEQRALRPLFMSASLPRILSFSGSGFLYQDLFFDDSSRLEKYSRTRTCTIA